MGLIGPSRAVGKASIERDAEKNTSELTPKSVPCGKKGIFDVADYITSTTDFASVRYKIGSSKSSTLPHTGREKWRRTPKTSALL
jgi:hypothetical protein